MPLIHCPNCGQPISDKATLCPHCNNQNWNPTAPDTLICAECGALYGKEESSCPVCGCPNNTNAPKRNIKVLSLPQLFYLSFWQSEYSRLLQSVKATQ